MKKITKLLAVMLVIALTVLTAVGCEGFSLDALLGGQVGEEGDVSVVIENRDGTHTVYKVYLEDIENKSEGAVGLLEYLAARENNPLALDMMDSTYGKYVNSIGGLVPDGASGEFVSVYTSVEADFGTWDGVGEKTYEGVTLKSSGVGVTMMQVQSGCVILFCIETY